MNRFVRSKNITEKNSRGYNIITGENKAPLNAIVPEKLRDRVDVKYSEKKTR